MQVAYGAGDYANLSASGLARTGPGVLFGIFVAIATTTPTIKVWDNTSAGAPVLVNTFTPVAGTFYRMPTRFKNGLFITLSGVVDCTVFFVPEAS